MPRAELLERYRALPMPTTTDESWRFTDLKGFDPDAFAPNGAASERQTPGPMLDIDVAGLATSARRDRDRARARRDPLRAARRVASAARHSSSAPTRSSRRRTRRAGSTACSSTSRRASSSSSRSTCGWRIRPTAARSSGACSWSPSRAAGSALIEELASPSPELAGYSNAVVELFVGQGAKVEYVSLQNLARETWHFASHRARVERDAELDWVAGGFGSKKGKVRIENDLAGQGATSRVTGAYFADGDQHLDYDTLQEHIAPNTTSDFAFKGALRDEATAVWRGMIRVQPDAQKTNAYQENRNLLLSPKAHADSIPGLEIQANDVRCTHGATVSQVDRDQLFYAMARGLTRADAERLILRGFFQDVLDRIELEPVREALAEALEARIPQT